MKSPLPRMTLDQRTRLLNHLATGADLPTVCNFVRATMAQLKLEMKHDPDFAQAVAAAEARVELLQMGHVNKAAEDEKNWRASVWWLERRDRVRNAGQNALSEDDVIDLIDELARAIVVEVHEPALQRRIIEQLLEAFERRQAAAMASLPPPILDVELNPGEAAAPADADGTALIPLPAAPASPLES